MEAPFFRDYPSILQQLKENSSSNKREL